MFMEWLDRMISVMDIISEKSVEGIGITELSKQTLISKGTLHRMLKNMVEHKLLTQDAVTKRYMLGPKSMLWGSEFLRNQDPTGLLTQYCNEIGNKTNLYSYICRFQSNQVYCTYTHQPSDVRHKYFVHLGQRMPLHCTSAAKAILAYQPPNLVDGLLQKEDLMKYTEYTKQNIELIKRELSEIRQDGIAFCNQELEVGVYAMSVPLFHENHKTAISLSLVGECQYIQENRMQFIKELKNISEQASEHLISMNLLSSNRI
ncbi:hypothetical protein CX649_07305 [Bacillaceae bacterium ZC4]|nr:hypothetical protein CX649_07305 [Bacillaceae bacterium ZC4]